MTDLTPDADDYPWRCSRDGCTCRSAVWLSQCPSCGTHNYVKAPPLPDWAARVAELPDGELRINDGGTP